jgi:hypothetical protein
LSIKKRLKPHNFTYLKGAGGMLKKRIHSRAKKAGMEVRKVPCAPGIEKMIMLAQNTAFATGQ